MNSQCLLRPSFFFSLRSQFSLAIIITSWVVLIVITLIHKPIAITMAFSMTVSACSGSTARTTVCSLAQSLRHSQQRQYSRSQIKCATATPQTTTTATISDSDHPMPTTTSSDRNELDSGGKNNFSGSKSGSSNHSKPPNPKQAHPPPPHPSTFPPWSYDPRPFFHFEILHQSSRSLARVGRIHTPHGIIDTPSYVAVATNGALKGVDFRDADKANQQLIFCNTYHLLLQPGAQVVERAGGLHAFVNRKDRPLITDSG